MSRDITVNPDRSITVTEGPDLNGKTLAYIIPAHRALAWLHEQGVECHHRDHEPTTVELGDLSEATRAEVEQVAQLTDLKIDYAERKVIYQELDVLFASRELIFQDVMAENRLDRIDEIEADIKMLRERVIFLDVCLGIASATSEEEGTK